MVICQIITTLGYGGAERLLVNFCNSLSEKHKIHIIYFKGDPRLKSELNLNIEVHHVPLGVTCATNLRKLIKHLRCDVVHTHLGHADLIGLWACRGLQVNRFCTMHNIWFKWNWKDHIIFFIYELWFKTIAKDCKVISISKSVENHVAKRLGVYRQNNVLLYNAIPSGSIAGYGKEQLREQLGIPEKSFCVLFVGRLEIQKSVDTLLYAIKRARDTIPNLQLEIVGNGSLMKNLQDTAEELDISSIVHFAGNTLEVEKYCLSADVFVLPSIFEGFGIVIIEAFRSSLPVVATSIEGPKELIDDNVNGLLFEPKNDKDLAQQITKLYTDSARRKDIGHAGYLSYLNRYDIREYANQIESLYTK